MTNTHLYTHPFYWKTLLPEAAIMILKIQLKQNIYADLRRNYAKTRTSFAYVIYIMINITKNSAAHTISSKNNTSKHRKTLWRFSYLCLRKFLMPKSPTIIHKHDVPLPWVSLFWTRTRQKPTTQPSFPEMYTQSSHAKKISNINASK